MSRWLSIFLNIIACSYSSSVVVPLCCENGTSNCYNYCEDKLEDPHTKFKVTWKNLDIEWRYAPILCTDTTSIPEWKIKIDTNGNLITACSDSSCCGNNQPSYMVDLTEENRGYCIDYLEDSLVAVTCVKEVDSSTSHETPASWWQKPIATKICWITSAVLLMLTCALIMTEISVKNETYVPYLVSQSLSLTAAFVCILCIQFEIPQCWLCMLTGYSLQYFGLSAFFWMNAKCINVYMILSGQSVQRINKTLLARLRWREFKISFVYAWGMPLLISATTYFLQMSEILENFHNLKPDIGTTSCFLQKRITKWIYFYGPMAVILVTNIVLFALTASVLAKHQISTLHLRKGRKSKIQKEIWFFNQYLKLSIVTGITWTADVLGWALQDDSRPWTRSLSKVAEIFLSMQGVFIFYFFVCQKEVLAKKLLRILLCSSWAYQNRYVNKLPSVTHDTSADHEEVLPKSNLDGKRCKSEISQPDKETRYTSTKHTTTNKTPRKTLSIVFSRSVESIAYYLKDDISTAKDVHDRGLNKLDIPGAQTSSGNGHPEPEKGTRHTLAEQLKVSPTKNDGTAATDVHYRDRTSLTSVISTT